MPSTSPVPLLMVVHPGSACGSADMNLGRDAADTLRLDLQLLIEGWEGGVAVIDGDLSDELDENAGRSAWRALGEALEQALVRASEAGHLSVRIRGDDAEAFSQEDAARHLVHTHGLAPTTAITLTGAWVDMAGGGCVNSVREVLVELGFAPTVSDAMDLDYVSDDADDLDDEEEEAEEAPVVDASSAKAPRARTPRGF